MSNCSGCGQRYSAYLVYFSQPMSFMKALSKKNGTNQKQASRPPTGSVRAENVTPRRSSPRNSSSTTTVATTGKASVRQTSVSDVTTTRPAAIPRATDGAHDGMRSSRRVSHSTMVAAPANSAGMMWHRMTRANRPAASANRRPVRTPRTSTARYRTHNVSEMEKANSPAIVEVMLPPRIV